MIRVSSEWRDGRGAPLQKSFEKRYRVVAADRSQPDAATWRLVPPTTADEPVVLEVSEALDRALLERLITVETAAGDPIAGVMEVAPGERSWSFRPERPWRAGDFFLRVGAELEDLGGNSLERLFDEPLDELRVGEVPLQDLLVPFAVTLPGRP